MENAKSSNSPLSVSNLKHLHTNVVESFQNKGCGTLTQVQYDMLTEATGPGRDMVVETAPGCGRYVGMIGLSAHSAVTAPSISSSGDSGGNASQRLPPTALVITTSNDSGHRLLSTSNGLGLGRSYFSRMDNLLDSNFHVNSPMVFVGNVDIAVAIKRSRLENCVAIIIEDASVKENNDRYIEVLEKVFAVSNKVTLSLLTSGPPSAIDVSLRYLLRRSSRHYLPLRTPKPSFTTLLCTDSNDRSDLCLRLSEMTGLRRVLILTHNKDVKDLKGFIHKAIGLRTFAIQRSTSSSERDSVLSDFLSRSCAVLVAMDAYTGLDLMDVDAVVQYHPPQKSMSDDEWEDFVTCVQTTGNPTSPCLVVTISAPDDLSSVKYMMAKFGLLNENGSSHQQQQPVLPVLNLSPSHVQFAELVRDPMAAVRAKGPPELAAQAKLELEQQVARCQELIGQAAEAAAAAHQQGGDRDGYDSGSDGGNDDGPQYRRRNNRQNRAAKRNYRR